MVEHRVVTRSDGVLIGASEDRFLDDLRRGRGVHQRCAPEMLVLALGEGLEDQGIGVRVPGHDDVSPSVELCSQGFLLCVRTLFERAETILDAVAHGATPTNCGGNLKIYDESF